ncbi:CLUMA_CG010337, isoform A [Clunio marinus]|uniref:CLUMA_CG010337, isoform A n=1 Tax=Clunio marinus TaxID=568069 RepID=A0A1J1IB36_9DIPT|nr:CLUMA_CG010337, isoform A [Clunio marinus]
MDEKADNPIAVDLNEPTTLDMFSSVCRICLQDGQLSSLYEKHEGAELSYSEKIMQVTHINLDRKNVNLPEQICSSCINDLEASYRFKMNCESSDAILQTYLLPVNISEVYTDASVDEDDIISEAESETEMPVDESDLYNYQSQMYDENGEMIGEEDNLENALEDELHKSNTSVDLEVKPTKPKKESTKARAARIRRNQIEKQLEQPKVHICEICGNSYKYRHALEVHMRRHRGDKPHKCEYCERCFVIRFELKRHMRTHTGQKPYGCRYCERKFSDFGSRIKHERSHTGERPYICQTCGKTFAYSHVLSGHMLTHTGEKRHQCQTCGKRFTKSHHLKSHLNTHLKALNKQASIAQTSSQTQDQIKTEPAIQIQNDEHDLMNVVQLGFQVINSEKY